MLPPNVAALPPVADFCDLQVYDLAIMLPPNVATPQCLLQTISICPCMISPLCRRRALGPFRLLQNPAIFCFHACAYTPVHNLFIIWPSIVAALLSASDSCIPIHNLSIILPPSIGALPPVAEPCNILLSRPCAERCGPFACYRLLLSPPASIVHHIFRKVSLLRRPCLPMGGNLPFRGETVHVKSWSKRSSKLSKFSLLLTRPSVTEVASSFTRLRSSSTCPTRTCIMVVGARLGAHIGTLRVPRFQVLDGREILG
jgi:hypothetical protein